MTKVQRMEEFVRLLNEATRKTGIAICEGGDREVEWVELEEVHDTRGEYQFLLEKETWTCLAWGDDHDNAEDFLRGYRTLETRLIPHNPPPPPEPREKPKDWPTYVYRPMALRSEEEAARAKRQREAIEAGEDEWTPPEDEE